ncbi:MAG: cobalamin-binding protein, partial [Dehalococcoidia bacterium]
MRIASLLPSATEIAFALGLGDSVVGVSHECDYPAQAARLPTLTASAVATDALSSAEVDQAISAHLRQGGSTYTINLPLLRRLQPDLILTQALCDACAVSEAQVHRTLHEQHLGARVLTLTPLTLDDVFRSIEDVGEATGRAAAARALTTDLRDRVAAIRAFRQDAPPRLLALEWLDPPFVGGHWVPDQIAAAGGVDVLGRPGQPSYRTTWEEIARAQPDVIVVLPCGFTLGEIVEQARVLAGNPLWTALVAVRRGAVWVVDAGAWFSRPAPRVVDGIDALAQILVDPLASSGPAGTVPLRH